MCKSSSTPQLAPGLIWRTIEDDAVVVAPQVGTVRVFNGIGTVIWLMLSEGKELPQILDHLIHQYDVPLSQAQEDLNTFLEELRARKLIVWNP